MDDGAWRHPKLEVLRANREYAAIALWGLSISYCGMTGDPRVTIHDAAMLLCCDTKQAAIAMMRLLAVGLFDHYPVSPQQTRFAAEAPPAADSEGAAEALRVAEPAAAVLHDWQHYRSKNAAKVAAGSKGGRITNEKHGLVGAAASAAGSQQTPQQTSSRPRSPEPEPEPEPVPVRAERQRPALPSLFPAVIEIPVRGGTHPVTQPDLDGWSELFPGLDVMLALKRCRQWYLDHPEKLCTKKRCRARLTSWLRGDHERREQAAASKPKGAEWRPSYLDNLIKAPAT